MSDLADRLELVKRVLLQADSDYTQECLNDVDEAIATITTQAEQIKELEDRIDQLEGTHLVAWAHQELGNMGEGGEG